MLSDEELVDLHARTRADLRSRHDEASGSLDLIPLPDGYLEEIPDLESLRRYLEQLLTERGLEPRARPARRPTRWEELVVEAQAAIIRIDELEASGDRGGIDALAADADRRVFELQSAYLDAERPLEVRPALEAWRRVGARAAEADANRNSTQSSRVGAVGIAVAVVVIGVVVGLWQLVGGSEDERADRTNAAPGTSAIAPTVTTGGSSATVQVGDARATYEGPAEVAAGEELSGEIEVTDAAGQPVTGPWYVTFGNEPADPRSTHHEGELDDGVLRFVLDVNWPVGPTQLYTSDGTAVVVVATIRVVD